MSEEPKDLKSRRAAVEAEIAKLEQAAADAREAHEVELLEARVEWAKKLGREGADFTIVDLGAEGYVVLKLGSLVNFKSYRAKLGDGQNTIEAAEAFILPCVAFPEKKTLTAILDRRGRLYDALVDALLVLHGTNEAAVKGK